MKKITILVPNDDLDSVTRNMLSEVARDERFEVVTAGPGEGSRGGVEAPVIKSKFDLKAIKAYRQIARRSGAAVTFSPSTSGLSTMLMATLGTGIRNIGYRGTQARVRRSDPTNWLALLNPRVAHVVCETHDIKQYLSTRIAPRKLSVAVKPFMLEWVADAMAAPAKVDGLPGDALKLIYIGMSKGRPHKGLRQLIDAMAKLRDRRVTLTVIGSVDEADIEAARGLAVTFLGPRRDAVSFLPSHDLYVLPSLRDASPRVVREAQACGVPCLVSDIPGARDLIAPEVTGLYIRPGDAEDIALKITTLDDDRERLARYASNTRKFIVDNFDMDAYVVYFKNLFDAISS